MANTNNINNTNNTVDTTNNELFLAVQDNDISKIEEAIAKGADINFLNSMEIQLTDITIEEGNSAFHLACYLGFKEVVQLLLDNGADINIKNKNGYNAIHYATFNGKYEIVDLLIKSGSI